MSSDGSGSDSEELTFSRSRPAKQQSAAAAEAARIAIEQRAATDALHTDRAEKAVRKGNELLPDDDTPEDAAALAAWRERQSRRVAAFREDLAARRAHAEG